MAGQQYQEGQHLQGSDGKVYVVQGGVPVLASSAPGPIFGTPDPLKAPLQQTELTNRRQDTQKGAIEIQRDQIKLDSEREAAEAARVQPSGNLHGDAYLKTLPPGLAAQVHGIAVGNITLGPRPFSNPQTAAMLQHVANYDPSFDMTDYGGRSKANAAFRSGPIGQNIIALNTALEHGNTVRQDVAALGNSNGFAGLANPIVNAYRGTSFADDPRPETFRNDIQAFSSEMSKVFNPTGGTAGERSEWQSHVGLNDGPNTQNAVLASDAGLLRSRLNAVEQQARSALGPNTNVRDFLSPQARDAYDKLIVGAAPGAPGGSTPTIQPPPIIPPSIPPTGGPPGSPPPGTRGGPVADKSTPYYDPTGGGGEGVSVANGDYRVEYDPKVTAWLDTQIKRGVSPDDINTALANMGRKPVDAARVMDAQRYFRRHPDFTGSLADASNTLPNTLLSQISASAPAAAASGFTNAVTAGYMDEIGGLASKLTGGDYTKTRDQLDLNKHMIADAHPLANFAGNVGGAMIGLAAPEAALGKLGLATKAGDVFSPTAMGLDAGYGALYGSGENNNDRLGGAALGGLGGMFGGVLGRGAIKGVGSAISPSGGSMKPLYDSGVFPTLGQRFADKGVLGRVINTGEQALQSVPGLGSLVARARNIPRNQFQIGAFNNALGDIGDALPAGMKPGTEPHAYALDKFNQAYDQARSGMQFAPDAQYQVDLNAFQNNLGNGILTDPQAAQLGKVIDNAVGSRLKNSGGALNGDAYKSAASDLGRAAQAWSKSPETAQQASALKDYISVFDQAARRNSHPDAVAALDAADTGYAKLVRIQDASAARGGDPGTFTPTQFDRSVQRNSPGVRSSAYNQGDALMQDYATAGKGLVDTLPNSGTGERLMTGQVVGGLAGTGGLAATGIPLAAAVKAAPVFAPYLPGLNYATVRVLAPRTNPLLVGAGNAVKNQARIGGMFGASLPPYLTSN